MRQQDDRKVLRNLEVHSQGPISWRCSSVDHCYEPQDAPHVAFKSRSRSSLSWKSRESADEDLRSILAKVTEERDVLAKLLRQKELELAQQAEQNKSLLCRVFRLEQEQQLREAGSCGTTEKVRKLSHEPSTEPSSISSLMPSSMATQKSSPMQSPTSKQKVMIGNAPDAKDFVQGTFSPPKAHVAGRNSEHEEEAKMQLPDCPSKKSKAVPRKSDQHASKDKNASLPMRLSCQTTYLSKGKESLDRVAAAASQVKASQCMAAVKSTKFKCVACTMSFNSKKALEKHRQTRAHKKTEKVFFNEREALRKQEQEQLEQRSKNKEVTEETSRSSSVERYANMWVKDVDTYACDQMPFEYDLDDGAHLFPYEM